MVVVVLIQPAVRQTVVVLVDQTDPMGLEAVVTTAVDLGLERRLARLADRLRDRLRLASVSDFENSERHNDGAKGKSNSLFVRSRECLCGS